MTPWVVTFTYRGSADEDTLVDTELCIAEHTDREVSLASPEPDRLTITVEVDAEDGVRAAADAAELLRGTSASAGLGDPPVLGVEALEADEYERRANAPTLPELMGASEVAELVGVSRQRVHQLHADHPVFPAPVVRVAMGPLWDAVAVRAFDRGWERRVGRPTRPRTSSADRRGSCQEALTPTATVRR